MNAPLKQYLDANPDLTGRALPQPMPGAATTRMHTVRAQAPGGELLGYIQHESVVYLENLYRKLPPAGMYDATPNKPLTFTMGSVRVPESMVLVVLDYSFDIYRFSGAAASDFVPLETNRLSTQVGWDININDKRPGQQLNYQIIPGEQTQDKQTFAPVNSVKPAAPQSWQFDLVRAAQNQGPAGPALSMMPQRHHRPGLVKVSNTYVARSSSVLSVTCSIINQIPIPIGFFEANIMGLLMPQNMYDSYQSANVPTGDPNIARAPASQ